MNTKATSAILPPRSDSKWGAMNRVGAVRHGVAAVVWLVCVFVGLGGCGGAGTRPACNEPARLQLRLAPHAQLNHDREGYSRSTVVRVYQLKAPHAFAQTGFEDIWFGDDAALLGAELVSGPEELTAVPGRPLTRDIVRSPEATHLAIAANFRKHQQRSGWKQLLDLPAAQDPCASDQDAPAAIPRVHVELAHYALAATLGGGTGARR